jgi:predicted negative regulator of RcsB-dependent stress response
MIKIIILSLFLNLYLYSSDEYFYDYIDNTGLQLSVSQKQQFFQDYERLNIINDFISTGDYKAALKEAQSLRIETSNLLIKSKAILLEHKAIYKNHSIKDMLKNIKILKKDIDSSNIVEADLHEAYLLYIDYLIKLKKLRPAKEYAKKIIETYPFGLYKDYGFIYLAKIHINEGKINQAQHILNKVLRDTNNVKIASIAASIQFDIFIKQNKYKKAKSMIKNVVKYNLDFFVNNPNLATQKIYTLMKNGMYSVAIDICKVLLKHNQNDKMVPAYLYSLATSELLSQNLKDAKENFIKIIHTFSNSKYAPKAKISLDEILLREGKLKPESLITRYKDSASMRQKILLQELLNLKKEQKYELILRQISIYKKISKSIVNRFGYKNLDQILNNIKQNLALTYLENKQCIKLTEFLTEDQSIFEQLIQKNNLEEKFLDCFTVAKYNIGFDYLYDKYKNSNNQKLLYKLEQSAMILENYLLALKISFKLEKIAKQDFLQKEIIDRFIIINNIKTLKAKNDFFNYINSNTWLLEKTKDPIIIDILYQYYLFLEKKSSNDSYDILVRLYNLQKELNIYVYSPFVDIELATVEYEAKNYNRSKEILEDVELKNTTKAKKVHRFHYLKAKIYDKLNMNIEYIQSIDNCVKANGESMWKELCKKVEAIDARK